MLKSVEMKQELEVLKNEARKLLEDKEAKLEDIEAKNAEIETLQAKIIMQEKLEQEEKEEMENATFEEETLQDDVTKEFINGLRTKFENAMSEGSSTDGGYTVPQDILTKINELRERKDALQNLITVEKVTAPTGSRVFKARAQQTGFAEVAENGSIPEKATPQFTQLTYSVKKYAGFLKVTNELLKDSDIAIRSTVEKWLGDESRVTRNKLILAELDKKAKTAIASVDDIKDVLNVQLDPAFRYTSVIVTNQDGFNWLDKQKDSDGNYLLQPSVSSPTGKQLFGVDIVMVSNKDLPSDTTNGTKAPFIIGDLKEAIVMFEKEGMELRASDVAGDAYLTDVTLFRAIEREEVKTRDSEAFVYGQVAIA
ncbi:phage major capsid protein (plasmid) [Crassaminicella thermophila]|uniref:Phage major capsid protein n=1 Tax=Crassaminicella thermophila TaxID=2599308 RepID=A0A5C0SHC3_CRATE|nr:phage major capsid protein [Crassaminicella thermophila]QEK13721.1 phage major capsid protein [Crassaminicella thermophila]